MIKIAVYIFLTVGVLYPLVFWFKSHIDFQDFKYKKHLTIANCSAGVAVIILLFLSIPLPIKMLAIFWKATLLGTSRYFWKKGVPHPLVMSVPCCIGVIAFVFVHHALAALV